jgi:Tfp pilus assembly protein FimV
MMNDQELINYKLELARAWIQNGHEDLAKDLVRSIIERDGGPNE